MGVKVNKSDITEAIKKRTRLFMENHKGHSNEKFVQFTSELAQGAMAIIEIQAYLDKIHDKTEISYSEWWCGITHDIEQTKVRHKEKFADNHYFQEFATLSEDAARFAECYFISEERKDGKMQGDEGGGDPDSPPTIVYVFKVK